jgi:hypothetical protein
MLPNLSVVEVIAATFFLDPVGLSPFLREYEALLKINSLVLDVALDT